MHRRDIAVCTRALNSSAYFKVWHQYYSRQVGAENLFVISISPEADAFREYKLGGLINLQSYPYDERQKARIFQNMMGMLLQTHKYVIICDVDEIIAADPRKYSGLLDFVEKDQRSYFSCVGFNVLHYDDEKPLDLDHSILLEQRSYARFASPLCKTCFTSIEYRVPNTFHYTEMYPTFGDLFLFHLKHADLDIEAKWGTDTRSIEFVDPTRSEHHNRTTERVQKFKIQQERLPVYSGEDSFPLPGTIESILSGVRFDSASRIYRWDRYDEPKVAKIPEAFRGVF